MNLEEREIEQLRNEVRQSQNLLSVVSFDTSGAVSVCASAGQRLAPSCECKLHKHLW